MLPRISPAERAYAAQGVAENVRADGRTRLAWRAFTLETNVLPQTNGSARLRIANTDIVVGVKAELSAVAAETPHSGRIEFSVECCPSACPEFEGRGADALNSQLSETLERLMRAPNALDLQALCIIPDRQCWVLFVDVLVLDSGGNLFDACSIAARAALFNVRLPKLSIVTPLGGGEPQIEVSDDLQQALRLNVDNVPLCITLTKIGPAYVADTTLEEELCMTARLSVGVNARGALTAVHKGGRGGLDPSQVADMLQAARKLGLGVLRQLDAALREEEANPRAPLGFFAGSTHQMRK